MEREIRKVTIEEFKKTLVRNGNTQRQAQLLETVKTKEEALEFIKEKFGR